MIKIVDCVYDIVSGSFLARTALVEGVLNLSAYAKKIQPSIEKLAKKKVEVNSIVVALSRLTEKIKLLPSPLPKVTIEELNIDAPLTDITYEKTDETIKLTNSFLQKTGLSQKQFATVIEGNKEITFVISQKLTDALLNHFRPAPKAVMDNLVGITLSFSAKYIEEPNVIYAILSKLALRRINIIEIISTYTELSVVVEKSAMQTALNELKELFA